VNQIFQFCLVSKLRISGTFTFNLSHSFTAFLTFLHERKYIGLYEGNIDKIKW
jgi:hypothetical protein